jgi:outer membrane protein OmpA-like peptidoglycan-associated protein
MGYLDAPSAPSSAPFYDPTNYGNGGAYSPQFAEHAMAEPRGRAIRYRAAPTMNLGNGRYYGHRRPEPEPVETPMMERVVVSAPARRMAAPPPTRSAESKPAAPAPKQATKAKPEKPAAKEPAKPAPEAEKKPVEAKTDVKTDKAIDAQFEKEFGQQKLPEIELPPLPGESVASAKKTSEPARPMPPPSLLADEQPVMDSIDDVLKDRPVAKSSDAMDMPPVKDLPDLDEALGLPDLPPPAAEAPPPPLPVMDKKPEEKTGAVLPDKTLPPLDFLEEPAADAADLPPPLPDVSPSADKQKTTAKTEEMPPLPDAPVVSGAKQVPPVVVQGKEGGVPMLPALPALDAEKPAEAAEKKAPATSDTALAMLDEAPKPIAANNVPKGMPDLTVAFDPAEVDVPLRSEVDIRDVAETMKASHAKRVHVVAYAGKQGSDVGNARRTALSRALAIRAFLIKEGIAPDRISTQALGSDVAEGGDVERADLFVQ